MLSISKTSDEENIIILDVVIPISVSFFMDQYLGYFH